MALKLRRKERSRVLSKFNDLFKKLHLALRLLLVVKSFNLRCYHKRFFIQKNIQEQKISVIKKIRTCHEHLRLEETILY